MTVITKHAMGHLSLNLHNSKTQKTGLSSVDTTLLSKQRGQLGRKATRNEDTKQLLDDLKDKRRHWELKEKALDRTLWRTCFG
jgi:hypothetical protein